MASVGTKEEDVGFAKISGLIHKVGKDLQNRSNCSANPIYVPKMTADLTDVVEECKSNQAHRFVLAEASVECLPRQLVKVLCSMKVIGRILSLEHGSCTMCKPNVVDINQGSQGRGSCW